jgi:succinate dehydrogenase / fumarate reductase cytochrome b subunit
MSESSASLTEERLPPETPTVHRRPKRELPFFLGFYRTAVGKKWVMAVSGIALLGYVLVHMIGNLHLYEGPRQVNEYADALRTLGGHLTPRGFVLWVLRIGLAAAFVIHIHAAYSLTLLNQRSRPQGYQSKRDYIAANFASRTMRWTGTIVLLFLLYHLADLTWGWTNPDFIHGDPYHNVVESLSNPVVAGFYLLAMVAVTIHIYHGAWSMFQSLGVNSPRLNPWRRGFAVAFAAVIFVGNCSFPIAVQLGLISEDDRCWPTTDQIHWLEENGSSVEEIEDARRQLEAQGATAEEAEDAICQQVADIPSDPDEPYPQPELPTVEPAPSDPGAVEPGSPSAPTIPPTEGGVGE